MDLEQFLQQFDGKYEYWKSSIEPRFGCAVCLSPKFKMVFGLCQHKICHSCAYDTSGWLKRTFYHCPTCQAENVFPYKQPTIPEDNITMQKLCGVRVCSHVGCGQEIWEWERAEHELWCPHKAKVLTPKCKTPNYRQIYSSTPPNTRYQKNVYMSANSSQTNSAGSSHRVSAEKSSMPASNRYPLRSRSPNGDGNTEHH